MSQLKSWNPEYGDGADLSRRLFERDTGFQNLTRGGMEEPRTQAIYGQGCYMVRTVELGGDVVLVIFHCMSEPLDIFFPSLRYFVYCMLPIKYLAYWI